MRLIAEWQLPAVTVYEGRREVIFLCCYYYVGPCRAGSAGNERCDVVVVRFYAWQVSVGTVGQCLYDEVRFVLLLLLRRIMAVMKFSLLRLFDFVENYDHAIKMHPNDECVKYWGNYLSYMTAAHLFGLEAKFSFVLGNCVYDSSQTEH